MSSWKGRSQANRLGYKIFVFLIRTFGLKFCYFVLRFVASYYFFFSIHSSRPVYYFYRKRLGLSFFRSIALLYTNYYRFGQTLLDKVAVMSQTETNFSFDFTGEENLHKMVEQGNGGILLSAHVGNWEAAGHMLKRLKTRINILMYDGEDAKIKKYMDEVTGKRTFNVIYVKDDLSHIYKISQALSANEIVCMHADRFLEGNKTINCELFGEVAPFPEGPFLLCLKLKVPVAFVHSFKESPSHYHFYSTELKYFYAEKEATVNSILKEYACNLEELLKIYPEQWFNYYNFWPKK